MIELELNVLPSGLCSGHPDGPRYFEFHPKYNVAYVVNELSSTVAVFEVDRALLQEMSAASKRGVDMSVYKGRSTLRLIQSIKTIPAAFPTKMNTCGRMCVHKSGRYVVVSNRGHQSIAVYKVQSQGAKRGELNAVGYFHTRGETPRHFQFDASGQFLLVANQDTDSLAVFNFNLSSGVITYTGNEYRVPSPNFVCCCPMHEDDGMMSLFEDEEQPAIVSNIDMVKPEQSTDSGVSSSENSCTMAVAGSDDKASALSTELEAARQEIAALRLQLNAFQKQQQQQIE
jgi:6-phosphogluconolactonase